MTGCLSAICGGYAGDDFGSVRAVSKRLTDDLWGEAKAQWSITQVNVRTSGENRGGNPRTTGISYGTISVRQPGDLAATRPMALRPGLATGLPLSRNSA